MYTGGDFDLAGFAVGAMERGGDLPHGIEPGDVLLGLASDGLHSNGFSLVRKVVEVEGLAWDKAAPFEDRPLGEALLTPTRLYVRPLMAALRAGGVAGLAHITGGGLTENLPRILPQGCGARIDLTAWRLPPVFKWLAGAGGLAQAEMLKTFNAGIGMVVVAKAKDAGHIADLLAGEGETVYRLGAVTDRPGMDYIGTLS